MYFTEGACIFEEMRFKPYKIIGNRITIYGMDNKITQYDLEIVADTLKVRSLENQFADLYVKPENLNTVRFVDLYYSQGSDFFDFNFYCDSSRQFKLEIVFHPEFDSGAYSGKVDENTERMLIELIHQMDLDVERELNQYIVSDVQEWAVIINTTDGGNKKLYYNYQQIDEGHNRFAFTCNFIPFLLALEKKEFDSVFSTVKSYRQGEFQRNIKEINQSR